MIEAAAQAGIRITLLDACYLHGGIGKPPDEGQLRFTDGDADAWARRVERAATTSRASRSAPRSTACGPWTRTRRRIVAAWAARARARRCTRTCRSSRPRTRSASPPTARTPTQLLAEAGALSERFSAVHATHVTDGDVALLGGAARTCCLCPTTERDLADGIGPARRLREAGARLALGSDSHAVIDLFEEARAVELDERLATRRARSAQAARPAARGHRGRLPEPRLAGGRPHRGGRAGRPRHDLARRRAPGRHTGRHALESVVFAGAAGDVRHVMVGGAWVVRDGAHVRIDVAAALAAALPG